MCHVVTNRVDSHSPRKDLRQCISSSKEGVTGSFERVYVVRVHSVVS